MFPAFVRGRALDLCLLAALLATSACVSGGPGTASTSIPGPVAQKAADAAAPRRKRPPRPAADSAALELAVTKRLAHRPLAVALTKRTQKPELADRAAFVVVQEAKRLRMSPSLLAAVLLIENARLDSTVVSTQGAIGMMQVMPVHAGSYGCSSSDLLNLEANICHGARILKTLLRRSGDMQVALRRYNGCVRGRHTPRCHRYPVRVLRTASRLRREILVNAATIPEPASPEIASSEDGAEVAESISVTESGAESAACGSFFACLRYRWSAPR